MGFRVGDDYRTSPLSLKPGGVVVCVKEANGRVCEYDKVKNPMAYMKAIKKENENITSWWFKDTPGKTYNV